MVAPDIRNYNSAKSVVLRGFELEPYSILGGDGNLDFEPVRSRRAASFSREDFEPCWLSFGLTPLGMSSWYVFEQHRDLGSFLGVGQGHGDSHLPPKAGSFDSNRTTSIIFLSATSSTNIPWNVSVSSEVLPRGECSGSW
jgi:hypothetical protein